ncbi:hypothetical protein BJ138DRAFT_1178988 [Hygrophoropsis aurantiaca]|uniref:Uncharacterized protein n=1 Tax=Hygrophoropsis aurantiaca TaxID=72124 RepID=A0ACB8AG72_9AGAM|nr:hypothetical protein BJ138DRAFT_1178988 [Hygrophoropsis aurantiaca]
MFGFRPANTSSPAKSIHSTRTPLTRTTTTSDVSRTSGTSTKTELQNLSPNEVAFLDAVVARIPLSATSFLSGLKAYNDELHERGLDSQTETVHYGRLLELCKVRGPSWNHKWQSVKLQHGYTDKISPANPPLKPPVSQAVVPAPARKLARQLTPVRDDDVFTLHSHQEETPTEAETNSDTDGSVRHILPASGLPTSASHVNPHSALRILALDNMPPVNYPRLSSLRPPIQLTHAPQTAPAWDDTSDTTEGPIPSPSTTPPSYRAAMRDSGRPRPIPFSARTQMTTPLPPIKSEIIAVPPPERKGSIINEDDAWKKIRMLRDEEDADKFRNDKLLERCWEVWLLGYQWLITTSEQVAEARDNVIIGSTLRRWRNATASILEHREQIAKLADQRCLRSAMTAWKARLKEKRQIAWRNDMRAKMKITREKREAKLRKDAWAKWRQSYRSHLSEQQYNERLVMRFFRRWNAQVAKTDRMEATADEFYGAHEGRVMANCWKRWHRVLVVRDAEKMVARKVGMRVMGEVMDVWKKHLRSHQRADAFYDVVVLKGAIRSWKAARDRIRTMERRAIKHQARQDDVLVRAVTRVWKARERGKLLERVKSIRLVKDAWATWKQKKMHLKQQEDFAIAFSLRSNSYTVSSALQTWKQVYTVYQNRRTFAVERYLARVQFDALLKWRIHLRTKLKILKQAKVVEKYFLQRRSINQWRIKLEDRRRLKKLKEVEARKLEKYARIWIQKSREQRYFRLAERQITDKISMRITGNALRHWTNRVIEIKLRELEVGQKNSNILLTFAFKKWKMICLRHVEDLSLMESHLDIKRSENIRRMFYRWLAAARARRRKRVTLREKEAEFDRASVAAAWDKWRDRFMDEKMRPIAYQVAVQSQKNLMFRAFGLWHSKTKSLPAIKFYTSRTKTKFWEAWRASMPQALQAKKARETYSHSVLSKFLEKWNQAYKTKRHLKEIARARYLRLPSVSPGRTNSTPKPPPAPVPRATRTPFPRRNIRPETDDDESDAGPSRPPSRPAAFNTRPGIASLLTTRPRAEAVVLSRPKLSSRGAREPSPTRSRTSVLDTEEPQSPQRPRFTARRNPSPARSKSSYGGAARDPSPTRPVRPLTASSSSRAEPERSRLWIEMKEARRRSRPPTERSRSPEAFS